jgi:hypothetical protein
MSSWRCGLTTGVVQAARPWNCSGRVSRFECNVLHVHVQSGTSVVVDLQSAYKTLAQVKVIHPIRFVGAYTDGGYDNHNLSYWVSFCLVPTTRPAVLTSLWALAVFAPSCPNEPFAHAQIDNAFLPNKWSPHCSDSPHNIHCVGLLKVGCKWPLFAALLT